MDHSILYTVTMLQAVRQAVDGLPGALRTLDDMISMRNDPTGELIPEGDLIRLIDSENTVLALIICDWADIRSSRLAQVALGCRTYLVLGAIIAHFPIHCWDPATLATTNNMLGKPHTAILAPAIANAAFYRPDVLSEWHVGPSNREVQDAFFTIQTAVRDHIIADDTYRAPTAVPGRSVHGFTYADVRQFYTDTRVYTRYPQIADTIYPDWLVGRR